MYLSVLSLSSFRPTPHFLVPKHTSMVLYYFILREKDELHRGTQIGNLLRFFKYGAAGKALLLPKPQKVSGRIGKKYLTSRRKHENTHIVCTCL